jgi:RNA polymerase sigma-70 factor (ECF subfamily)
MMRSSATIPIAIPGSASSDARSGSLLPSMDETTFQILYSETAPRLWSYIRRASGNAALADDILQESFFRFLRADLPSLGKFQMKAYLYRIASSLLADHWRQVKREQRWSLEALFGARTVKNAESSGDTLRLFADLEPREQMLLWLAYVEGFDHAEIASALQVNQKSVRVLLFRARKKLAGILTSKGIGPEGES